MGLIKTAMYAGAGMYAVNKISKEMGKKNQGQSNGNYQQNPQYQQQYYQGPNQQQPQQMQFRDSSPNSRGSKEQPRLANYSDQEPVYLNNTYPQYQYAGQSRDEPAPQYYRAPIQQGYVEPEEVNDQHSDRFGQFAQMASGFMGSKGKDDKKSKSNMFSELLQK